MRIPYRRLIPLLAALGLLATAFRVSTAELSAPAGVWSSAGEDVPGRVVHSWLANSFATRKGHQFVPVTAVAIAVTPDGTVFSAGVAEAYGGVASYKGGEFVTKYDYDSGFGSSAFAVPCGYVAGASTWHPGNGKRWPEDAETFIWTDANANGAPDPEEFVSVDRKPRWGHMHVDARGGIWQCSPEDRTIFYLPCEGVDARGNPIYRRVAEVMYPFPPEFTGDRPRRLFYIPDGDRMSAGGSLGPEQEAWNVVVCYDRWSDATRRGRRWTIRLPSNDTSYTPETGYGGGAPQAMQACGDYLFVAYGSGLVRVHRLGGGGYVGTIRPAINGYQGGGGWVDSDNALNVTRRKKRRIRAFLGKCCAEPRGDVRWTPPND